MDLDDISWLNQLRGAADGAERLRVGTGVGVIRTGERGIDDERSGVGGGCQQQGGSGEDDVVFLQGRFVG